MLFQYQILATATEFNARSTTGVCLQLRNISLSPSTLYRLVSHWDYLAYGTALHTVITCATAPHRAMLRGAYAPLRAYPSDAFMCELDASTMANSSTSTTGAWLAGDQCRLRTNLAAQHGSVSSQAGTTRACGDPKGTLLNNLD